MSIRSYTSLTNEFLKDHRRMTRLLRDVVERLESGDVIMSRSLADELDQVAGPHIAFEETVLYPAVGGVEGDAFEQRLLWEHEEARSGLAKLLTADVARLDDVASRTKIVAALRTGLKHAESCGTLASHLEQFSDDQRQKALARLEDLRQSGGRWTTRSR